MLKSSAWELGTKPQREIALFSVAFNESLNFFYMSVRSRNAWGGGGRGEQTLISALVSPVEKIAIT